MRKVSCLVCALVFVLSLTGIVIYFVSENKSENTVEELRSVVEATEEQNKVSVNDSGFRVSAGVAAVLDDMVRIELEKPVILAKYQELYETNSDIIGWLRIEDTVIDYPVMQTMEDEGYYLDKDFYGEADVNGCLIMDTDSVVGTGRTENNYAGGITPSTNLIIHGHTMRSGAMFGNLKLYADEAYGMAHNRIYFDSLYEEREYELIAVFYSQVFYESEDVFKYYKFFQADTPEEFDIWYTNIKEMSLYDTGVTAEFGDEFITLSCCAYHVEDGRFVVVGRRIL